MKTKITIAPITPEADRAKRGAAGDLPPTAGVYSRSFVEPRPEPGRFAHPADYSRAVRKWKADYPNFHTAEEEAAHVAEMAILRARDAGQFLPRHQIDVAALNHSGKGGAV